MPLGFRTVGSDERLALVDHLSELRRRMIIAIIALVVAFAVAYIFRDRILSILIRPLPAGKQKIVTLSPTEPFITIMEVCLWTAILIALPILLYQVYAFVIPAVGRHTRRAMLAIVGAISGLFLVGVLFGYYLVLPVALQFFLGFGGSQFVSQVRAEDYFGFVATLLFVTGITFEVPLAMAAFARMGIVTPEMFRRQWRLAIVAIAAVAAFLPTGDPFSMLLVMVPMIVLYVVGIWMASVFGRPLIWKHNPLLDADSPSDDSVAPPA
jgi:sec-independent protein translocase protein TatC